MSALQQLIKQYRKETNIKKSRKRPRDTTDAEKTYLPERTTKTCINKTPNNNIGVSTES